MPLAVVNFMCTNPGCGAEVQEVFGVGYPDFSAERMSDGDSIETHDAACCECAAHYEIETVNGMGGFYATLDGETINGYIDYEPEYDEYEEYLLSYEPTNDTIGAFGKARLESLPCSKAKAAIRPAF